MWQRIQTLYLAIATALIAAMFFCDKAEGISFVSYWPYTVLMVLSLLLHILALTTWKFRIFQVRTAVLAAIITLALQAWLVVDFIVTGNDPLFHVPALFPLVAVILDILAARGIWADELMVRSSSRLRSSKRKKH
jgi:peptidoglycan/LPS O-acetylase OafA/YrhL